VGFEVGSPSDEVEQSLSSPQMDAEVEAEISAVRQTPVWPLMSADDDAVEAAIAAFLRSTPFPSAPRGPDPGRRIHPALVG
jgi:hypothetical protein